MSYTEKYTFGFFNEKITTVSGCIFMYQKLTLFNSFLNDF
jgi:hypothetical protein